MPVYASRPFRLREHLDRLNRSLAGIRMSAPLSHADWAQLCQELIARNTARDAYLYIQVTRGAEFGRNHAWPEDMKPTVFAYVTALEPLASSMLDRGVSAVTAADTRWARRDIKSTALLANILLKKLAADAGALDHHAGKRRTDGRLVTRPCMWSDAASLTRPTATTIFGRPDVKAELAARLGFALAATRRPTAVRGRDLAGICNPRRIAGHHSRRRCGGRRQARPDIQADAQRLCGVRAELAGAAL